MNCPNCGKPLHQEAKFCMDCGHRVPRCPTCGTVLLQRAEFCMVDGTRIPDEINALLPEQPQAAAPDEIVVKPTAAEKPVQQAKQPSAVPKTIAHTTNKQKPKKPPMNDTLRSVIPLLVILAVTALIALGYFVVEGLSNDKAPHAAQQEMNEMAEAVTDRKEEENTEDQADAVPEEEQYQETEPAKILMPNCVGLHYDEVAETFASIPCQLSYSYSYSDTVAENYILEQNLAEGTELTPETEVIIAVSKGQEAAPPEGYHQKVTLTAAPDSSYGTLTLYDWEEGQWVSKFTCDATLGKKGISPDYGEGKKRTPEGVFKLGVALTANSLSNETWPVYLVSSDTCVVDDVNSSAYNTIQSIRSLSSGISYDPIGRTITQGTSNICIYIEHNGNGYDSENVVAGKGSVITICGRNSSISPTSGCVDISASNMKSLISMLSYEKNPHIEIYTQ